MTDHLDFGGSVRPYGRPLPTRELLEKQEAEEVEKYIEDHNNNPILRKYHRVDVSSRWHSFLIVFFMIIVIFSIVGGTYLLYLVNKDKLKSEISFTPEINSNTENNYNFSPSTQNQFTNQFNISVVINTLEVITNST